MQFVRPPLIAPLPLIEALRALPAAPEALEVVVRVHAHAAEQHGLGGVLFDTCRASHIELGERIAGDLAAREVARDLDHTAQLAMLRRIDAVLVAAGIRAVVLKGAALAERLYAHPSARGATDIDLLVASGDLDRAVVALAGLGYAVSDGDEEQARLRREHHHLHLAHPSAIPLELHFDAYRGFGSVLDGAALVARSVTFRDLRAVRVLSASDELVYLMVHAAAHRFGRLSWLYDIKLLLSAMTPAEIVTAAKRAEDSGFSHVVSLAAVLMIDVAGVEATRVSPLIRRDGFRRAVAAHVAAEPANPVMRAATRFVYTAALCADRASAARYAKQASVAYVRRILVSRA